MDVYKADLTGLLGLCAALYAAQSWFGGKPETSGDKTDNDKSDKNDTRDTRDTSDTTDFLAVYALIVAGDWLQWSSLYALYTDKHGVATAHVSLLLATGSVAGAVSALFVGRAADRHGRKRACLVLCAASAAASLLTAASASASASGALLPVLLAGRVLGGASASLLCSTAESWMVTAFWEREKYEAPTTTENKNTQKMDAAARLSHTFGRMGTVGSLAAMASGALGEWVVAVSGSSTTPFVASAVLLGAACWRVHATWEENYGAEADERADGGGVVSVLSDPRVLVLGMASTLFEGCACLVVWFWMPALADAASGLPYGVIAASFLAAAAAASLLFGLVAARLRLVRCVTLLLVLLGAAEAVFTLLSSTTTLVALSAHSIFWLLCVFAASVGTYWPCMGYLRGQVVPDGARAEVYALLRLPLCIFVAAAPLMTRDSEYYEVFGLCSTLVLVAIAAVLAMMMNEPGLH